MELDLLGQQIEEQKEEPKAELHETLLASAVALFEEFEALNIPSKIMTLNAVRLALSKHSPFANEPVDCVQWIKSDQVAANDYNPNAVAPPEMKLLAHSVAEDGYTQPIVSWKTETIFEVVDGFHRNRVGREVKAIRERVHGYLPLVVINTARSDKGDRMAATIRHNRARGKHRVDSMSDIVLELKRRNWSDEKIGKELGMEPDEVLRLAQITGLAEMFKDRSFSEAWEAESFTEAIEITETLEEVETQK